MNTEERKTKVYYVRESFVQSLLADMVSFGFLIGMFFVNEYWLSSKWYIDIFIMLLFFMLAIAKGSKRYQVFNSVEDLKNYLDKQL